ncbi:MAG: thermonuclease family protein [Candidatus Omnitrophica bacterium]|nr:thermonuclease family protein [Candidatus Omnitrophota bacterium]MDD5437262.1 thermonuclease family protein [Candidatus Omnitrophota bacterium]
MRIRKELKLTQAIVLAILVVIYAGAKLISGTGKPAAVKSETAVVARAVDGDTLKLSDGRRVRLIGVDTPEVHYSNKLLRDSNRSGKDVKAIQALGKRSADFTRQLCEGKRVRMETDVKKFDKYGRLLAYVYLEDGTFVNARILEDGYGQVMTIPPNVKYADRFLKLQQQARDNHKGLWADTDSL